MAKNTNQTQDTSAVFAEKLTELRKSKKLSQKQVAKDLGISQALLSHYENGVRECGLSFVVKAADYYNVTCDFLLGNSNSTISIAGVSQLIDIPEDKDMSTDTIVRAAITTSSRLKKEPELLDFITKVYSIATYFTIYAGIKKGALPISWIGDNPLNMDTAAYLGTTVSKALHDVHSGTRKHTKEKVPDCVSTVSSFINDYLNISIASLL